MQLPASSLDLKLGFRMLLKHRGLTLIGGFAIAVAIAIGSILFEGITKVLHSDLPLPEGDRVVAIQYSMRGRIGNAERKILHDFVTWRDDLVSIRELGAFRTITRNLTSGDGPPEPVKVAEMTASGFGVARTPPLLGRYLLPEDEGTGAGHVVVIGYEVWQRRFGADPGVVGSTIQLGGVPHVLVGVMPEGFAFPVRHEFWTPLPADPSAYKRLQGPSLFVFGRLAPGATLNEAQAELTVVERRTAAAHPETHAQLRAVVLPYTREHVMVDHPVIVRMLRTIQIFIGLLMVVVAVNLAILIYARTVSRFGEIAVRSALGASRRRILAQLFLEAIALSAVGALLGLALAQAAFSWLQPVIASMETIPYWINPDISFQTVLYALGLATFGAVIMGVLPGMKATGRPLHTHLRELGGGNGTRLGRTWTFLIVAQVAIAVAVLPIAVFTVWQVVKMELSKPGFPAEKFLMGLIDLQEEPSATGVDSPGRNAEGWRFGARHTELMRRLEAEPGVSAVTFSSGTPGFEPSRRIEFDADVSIPSDAELEVAYLRADINLFEVFGAKTLVGRAFDVGDVDREIKPVVVNRTFAQRFLGNATRLGQRFHYPPVVAPADAEPTAPIEWYEVVGIVEDFPTFAPPPGRVPTARVYHPAAPGDIRPVTISVRLDGTTPSQFVGRFREISAEVDPELQLRRVMPLPELYGTLRSLWRFIALGFGLVTSSVLGLSAAGVYALMSFTVAQRTREIGIRAALGAQPRRILAGIFARAVRQLAAGLVVGSVLSAALLSNTDLAVPQATLLLLSVAALMLATGLVAAIGPARRGLRVQPSVTLRAE